MKLNFRILTMFILIGLATSCGESVKYEKLNYKEELNKTRFTNTYAEFDKFWRYGIEDYGVEVLCGCNCDATLSLIDMWNEGNENIPSHLSEIEMNPNSSCEDLRSLFKQRCEFDNIIDFKNSVINRLEPTEFFTNEEIGLVTVLLNSIIADNFDFNEMESRWENLSTVSSVNNSISQLLIETTRSLHDHHLNNPDIWNLLPDAPGEPKVSKWIWKVVGAVGGAYGGVIGAGVTDIISNGGNQSSSDLTGTDVALAAGWGALTGAVASF